ncbi:MAG: pyridine nucleotide-disulfide oxidoreductase [Deltaproteobacteria bacterium]|nr:MAG: pyridine nucleotide-disulfide oxidoreductase [Deltaproteobacteria bacterium]
MKILIIGGDAAGMSAASRIKRKYPENEVTVLEATQDVSYSACTMPYSIADPDDDIERLIVRAPEKFKETGIKLHLGHRVTGIDRKNKKVYGKKDDEKEFEFDYDKLFIATGNRPFMPPVEGLYIKGVFPLKSLEDGRKIDIFLENNNVRKALIIGMGYIGIEMCEALHSRNIEITMVEAGNSLLPWLHKELRSQIEKELEEKNVKYFTGKLVKKIEKKGEVLIVSTGEEFFETDMVIASMGVVPNTEFAVAAGIEPGPSNALKVNEFMQTNDPDIYSAGDCASAKHIVSGKDVWIPLALTANRGGRVAAENITEEKKLKFPGTLGTAVFKAFDYEIARTGLNFAESVDAGFEPVEIIIKTRSKAHTCKNSQKVYINMIGDKKSGKLLGLFMVGKEGVARRINSGAVALHAKMKVKDLADVDTAYAPPFSPVWDPVILAAGELAKKII